MSSVLVYLMAAGLAGSVLGSPVEPTTYAGTTLDLQQILTGRCLDYDQTKYIGLLPRVDVDCDQLVAAFLDGFSYKPACNVSQSDYEMFLDLVRQSLPENKVMFWSGVYNLAHQFSDNARRYVTLEDTLTGYMANSLIWCGQSSAPGINFTRCPEWHDCPSEASESFWAGASTMFALEAKGDVHVMLDGSNPKRPAYRRASFFGKYELPNLSVKDVTSVKVLLTHRLDDTRAETCESASLLDLHDDVTARGFPYSCQDNPSDVVHLLCVDDPTARECELVMAHMQGHLPYSTTPHPAMNAMPDSFA